MKRPKKMNCRRRRFVKRFIAVGAAAVVLVSLASVNSATFALASDTADEIVMDDVSSETVIQGEVEAIDESELDIETAESEPEEISSEDEDAEVSVACIEDIEDSGEDESNPADSETDTDPETDTETDTKEETGDTEDADQTPADEVSETAEFDLASWLDGSCMLMGRETNKDALALVGGTKFSFTVTDAVGNEVATGLATPYPENVWCDEITWTGNVLEYTEPGTYRYTIRQVIGCIPALTYDPSVYVLTVAVTNENGVWNVEPVLTKNGIAVKCAFFKNLYDPDPVTVDFDVYKSLEGRDLIDGEFGFRLAQYTTLPKLIDGEYVSTETAVNDADGEAVFSQTYSACGIYYYTISELVPEDAFDTVAYDTTVYYVKVNVFLGEDGQLAARAYYSTDTGLVKDWKCLEQLTFSNSFQDTATISLDAEKILVGRELAAGEFSFTLTDEYGVTYTATNDEDGSILFGEFTYDQDDIGKTFTYTVTEDVPEDGLDGITYDMAERQITVAVSYNAETGRVEAAITSEDVVFCNIFDQDSEKQEDPENPDDTDPGDTDPDDTDTDPGDTDPDDTDTDPGDTDPDGTDTDPGNTDPDSSDDSDADADADGDAAVTAEDGEDAGSDVENTSDSVKTGDKSDISFYLILFGGAVFGLTVWMDRKRIGIHK